MGGVIRKEHKYHAKKRRLDGYTFDSEKEALRYMELDLMQKAGEITGLRVHPHYPLVVNDIKVGEYWPDFEYYRAGVRVVEDVKGMQRGIPWNIFRMKSKLFMALYGTEVTVI